MIPIVYLLGILAALPGMVHTKTTSIEHWAHGKLPAHESFCANEDLASLEKLQKIAPSLAQSRYPVVPLENELDCPESLPRLRAARFAVDDEQIRKMSRREDSNRLKANEAFNSHLNQYRKGTGKNF